MNVLIVLAHPEPQSFNYAMAEAMRYALAKARHEVTVSDLFAEGFNPVAGRHDFTTVADASKFHYQSEQALAARENGFAPEIAREQARVAAADLLILQFPLWWGGPPAILKGWFERVLAYGFAYVDGHRFDTGLFKGRRALLSVTSGGTEARFGDGVYGPVETVLWQPQHLTLEYMGYTVEPPFIAYGAPRVDDAGRARYLEDIAKRATETASREVVRQGPKGSPLDLVDADAWSRKA